MTLSAEAWGHLLAAFRYAKGGDFHSAWDAWVDASHAMSLAKKYKENADPFYEDTRVAAEMLLTAYGLQLKNAADEIHKADADEARRQRIREAVEAIKAAGASLVS